MKVLLFGANGWIGQQFCKVLSEHHIDYIPAQSRADDKTNIEEEINRHKPTHIVSFIGRTHGEGINTIDYLEQPGKLQQNIRDNLFSPIQLALLAQQNNIHFTYLGTGCIFSQEHPEQTQYDEDAHPDFFGSSYSIVKGFTDRLVHLFPNTLNLRIRMPITGEQHPRNFITKIVNYDKVCSIPNSMTVLPDMFPIIIDMMKKETTGTINLTNPGIITHNEILQMYKEIVDPDFTWKNFTMEEQDQILKSKRSNNQLCTDKLLNLYPGIKDIKASVRECLIKMASSRK